MLCNKEQFNKELELIIQKFNNTKIYPLIKDLSDSIVFSCIYAGKNDVVCEKIKKEEKELTKFTLKSYDITQTIVVMSGDKFYSFEKFNDTKTYKYKSVLELDGLGNFNRVVTLEYEPLNSKQIIEETVLGTLKNGVYLSETKEKETGLEIVAFKLPNDATKKDNVFYSYKMPPDAQFMCRAREKFTEVPFVEMLGMNRLSTLLAEQFDDNEEPLRIEDSSFFKSLKLSAKAYYFIKKKVRKNSPK